jgi:hypothetical protein
MWTASSMTPSAIDHWRRRYQHPARLAVSSQRGVAGSSLRPLADLGSVIDQPSGPAPAAHRSARPPPCRGSVWPNEHGQLRQTARGQLRAGRGRCCRHGSLGHATAAQPSERHFDRGSSGHRG